MNKVRDAEIAELLRTCRERAKLSQQDLAVRLYIDQAIVSKVENGKLTPSYTLVRQWARATKSEDLIAMHMAGHADVTKKYQQLETAWKQAKSIFEAVSLMKIKPGRSKKNATST